MPGGGEEDAFAEAFVWDDGEFGGDFWPCLEDAFRLKALSRRSITTVRKCAKLERRTQTSYRSKR